MTELKAFANDINVTEMMISPFDRVENTVGKGENAGYQHSLFFPYCFPKPSSEGLLKSGLWSKELKVLISPFKRRNCLTLYQPTKFHTSPD